MWLAGLLEGEGSFLKAPPSRRSGVQVSVEMTDEDVVRRAADLLGSSVVACKARRAWWKPSWRTCVRGHRAILLMKTLRPLMGQRRQGQIDSAIASYDANEPWARRVNRKIPDIETLREMRKTMSLREIGRAVGCTHGTIHLRLKNAS